MFDELLAKIFAKVRSMSAAESRNLDAIVKGKIAQREGRPADNVPAAISPAVAEVASQLDVLSAANLGLLESTINDHLKALERPPHR
jgi:hypothetical protein